MRDISVKIMIATHKPYPMPKEDMYLPLHVGAEGKTDAQGNALDFGYLKDHTGDHISGLNPGFCELTGLYWAWKNLKADYMGLVHYRRHFSMKQKASLDHVLTYEELRPYLGRVKVFVPRKRRYYIETLYSHYKHTHYAWQLDETRKIIQGKHPAYLGSFDKIMNRTYGYMFNMMIMDREMLDDYCTWLFDVLFGLMATIPETALSAFQGRFYGRISELLFNVWLDQKRKTGQLKPEEIMELPYMHLEKVNWWKKGWAFLQAKFFGKKYEGSF